MITEYREKKESYVHQGHGEQEQVLFEYINIAIYVSDLRVR